MLHSRPAHLVGAFLIGAVIFFTGHAERKKQLSDAENLVLAIG